MSNVRSWIKRIVVLLLPALIAVSCNRPKEAPVFKRIANVKVTEVNGKEALLNGDAFFYNPNDVSMKLRKVNIDVKLEGKKIGSIKQELKTKIPALSEFKVPVDATFNIGDIGVLNSLFSVIGGKKMKVHYTGNIKISIHGVPLSVPVDYEDEIRLRL